MKKAFAALALLLVASCTPAMAAEPLTYEEAAVKLEASVGKLRIGSRDVCTAWKMKDGVWATAWHCVALTGKKYSVRTNPFGDRSMGVTLKPKSLLLPAEKAADKNHWEDWAVINTEDVAPEVPGLSIQCQYDLKLGEEVAYMGFPSQPGGMSQHFSVGVVNAIADNRKKPYHFTAQFSGGPGASGSPVLSLKTGKVIGFVTRGIPTRGSLLSVGMESVNGMDACDDVVGQGIGSVPPTKAGMYGSH